MPLLACQQYDEVLGNQSQAEHAGEGDEAGETQQLTECPDERGFGGEVAVAATTAFPQYGLRYTLYHSADGGDGHVVPLACVAVDTGNVPAWVETAEQYPKGVVVQLQGEAVD